MEKTTTTIKQLKKNGFVIIDGAPCRVDRVDVSKSGKHGAAKARVEAVGLLDGRRHNLVKPADETVDVPIITRHRAQVLSIMGSKVHLMDLSNYSIFELDIPEGKEIKQAEEIEYFEVCDTKTLKEIK